MTIFCRVWDAASGEEIKTITLPCSPADLELSKDGAVLTVPYGKNVAFYDLNRYMSIHIVRFIYFGLFCIYSVLFSTYSVYTMCYFASILCHFASILHAILHLFGDIFLMICIYVLISIYYVLFCIYFTCYFVIFSI